MYDYFLIHLSVEDAVRKHGLNRTRRHYQQKREWALDENENEEAEEWDRKYHQAEEVFEKTKQKYSITVVLVGFVITFIVAYALDIEDVFARGSTGEIALILVLGVPSLLVVTIIAIVYITEILWWCVGGCILVPAAIAIWQTYEWLKTGDWPELNVFQGYVIGWDQLFQTKAPDLTIYIEDWVGATNFINGAIDWYLTMALGWGVFVLFIPLTFLAVIASNYCRQPDPDGMDW